MSADLERAMERTARQPSRPLDVGALPRRATRLKLQRFVAAGTVVMLLGGGGTLAIANWERRSDGPVPPAGQEAVGDFARYEIELGQGSDANGEPVPGSGFVEVDAEDDEICIDADVKGVTQLHMHHEPTGETLAFPDRVGFPDRVVDGRGDCFPTPPDVTRSILNAHDEWYVEFHNEGSGGTIRSELRPLPPPPIEDRVASEVIEHLQVHARLCRGFDFFFRVTYATGSYRPVQCGAETRVKDVFVETPPEDPVITFIRGPGLVVYGFSDTSVRDSWLEGHPVPLGGRVVGDLWIVDVMNRSIYRRIASAAIEGAEEAIGPPDAMRIDEHMIEPLEGGYWPEVSLGSAVDTARIREELLGAQLVIYSDETTEDVQAIKSWLITLRRCVEGYGGMHAAPDCEGDQTYVVVDAETGEVMRRIPI